MFYFFILDPPELRVVKKECFNRWYGLTPYYLALTISRLPIQIILNVIFSFCVYFLAGLPLEFNRFALFALVGVVVSIIAEGLGLAIGATFNVTVSGTCRLIIIGNKITPF
jgi:ABC-type multidrug transport system permease subunit